MVKFKQYEMIRVINDIPTIPVNEGDICIYLGEIPNMKGHIVFVCQEKIYWGYHPENFIKLRDDEL